jgi:hypothetical protein
VDNPEGVNALTCITIADPAELRDLNRQLIAGLDLYLRQFERTKHYVRQDKDTNDLYD